MNRPEIGKLNRRVKIFHTMSVPDGRLGFSKASVREDVVWGRLEPVGSCIYFGSKQIESGVTHRVIVRSMPGRTGPRDFTGLDAIRRSAAVITMAGYNPSHVILHPLDYDDILGMKDKQGRYLFGDPSGAADSVVWGLQPCVSPEVTQGKFMVVDPLMGGTVYDRTGLELQAFPQDGDNVQKNLVTIRAEKRVAFSVDAVGCFVGGDLKIAAE